MKETHPVQQDPDPLPAAHAAEPALNLRPPCPADGAAIWSLVRESTLDDNSPYAYLMLARYHRATCAVAERRGRLAGFVSAFLAPDRPHTLFVWQIGVAPSARGCGLANRLVATVLARPACAGVRYLEATVAPSNRASLALFRGLADRLSVACHESTAFPAALFPSGTHEEERLLRIGPFGPERLQSIAHLTE